MKICAIICEYNPFHNGHLYQLSEARKQSGADAVLCLMSGNFVQRGEAAILDKYTRSKHALLAGADIVIELPTPFATSNAELFAKGAIHLLSHIPSVKTLCFGAENADKLTFYSAARLLNEEPQEVSEKIKKLVSSGASYARARSQAFAGFIPLDVLVSPNNILGLEYMRAILANNANIDILPLQRKGANYTESILHENFSSASAIRSAVEKGECVQGNVPNFVLDDLPKTTQNQLELLEKYALLFHSEQEISSVCDCTEGLENALKRAAETNEPLTQLLTSARYTSSRIRRIALQNLLKIQESLIRRSLQSPLYLRILAAKKERSDVLSALGESDFPIIARAHDKKALSGTAKECFEKDLFAEKVYGILCGQNKDKNIFI